MTQRARFQTRRVAAVAFISAAFCVTTSSFPGAVAADILSTQTRSLLPGSNTCISLAAYGFTPYIYDGALHSFEFTIPDSSYVALTGSAGDTFIPFQHMTRRGDANQLRVHVDTETIKVVGSMPLSVTLVSAKPGQQTVCMSTVIMTASVSEGRQTVTSTPPTTSGSGGTVTKPTQPAPGRGGVTSTSTPGVRGSTSTSGTIGTTSQPIMSSIANLQNNIVRSCMEEGGAVRLWMILLTVFAGITALAVFLTVPQMYTRGQRGATIVVPLVLLLAFWYLTESCRATVWAPIAALVIAALGILGLYWNDPRISGYTDRAKKFTGGQPPSRPNASTPMITPPPSSKPKTPVGTPPSKPSGL